MLDPIERALNYPYTAPDGSYLYDSGRAEAYRQHPAIAQQRFPVIGYGSNRSPERLLQKYPEPGQQVPVEAAWLDGFDVVHAACIGSYAAIPATIAPSPGCRLPVKITWLSLFQLPAMHRSEGIGKAYDFGVLNMPIDAEHSGRLSRAFVYVHRNGAFAPGGLPVPFAEIGSKGRPWPAMGQRLIQQSVADWLQPGASVEDFVSTNLGDRDLRLARSRQMAARGQPWHHPSFRKLSP